MAGSGLSIGCTRDAGGGTVAILCAEKQSPVVESLEGPVVQ